MILKPRYKDVRDVRLRERGPATYHSKEYAPDTVYKPGKNSRHTTHKATSGNGRLRIIRTGKYKPGQRLGMLVIDRVGVCQSRKQIAEDDGRLDYDAWCDCGAYVKVCQSALDRGWHSCTDCRLGYCWLGTPIERREMKRGFCYIHDFLKDRDWVDVVGNRQRALEILKEKCDGRLQYDPRYCGIEFT